MPQAILAAAVWVGSSAAFAATAAGASMTLAAVAGYAAIGATIAGEVYALNTVSKLLAPKVGGDTGTSTSWTANPRAGIPYAVGRCKVGGSIVFAQSAGSSNKFLNFVTVYTGAGPIDSYEQFYAGEIPVSFTADGGEGASGYYLNRMWMKRQLGGAADPWMHWTATGSKDTPANHGGMPYEWTADHLLSGYAASLWALEYDTARYGGGVPAHGMVAKWVKVYDPRQDSTHPGGSGPMRAGVESTYAWSANPYLHALTWIIGRFQNGKRILGLGVPVSKIDVAAFVEGANVCDANGWTCHGLMFSTDDKFEVLKAFLQAGAGKPMLLGNKISCFVNMPRVSLATITAADVIGDANISAGAAKSDRINMIWPTYVEETQNWEKSTPDDPVAVPEYFDDDDGERSLEVEYPLVTDIIQVAQLARYDIEDSREPTPISLPCKPIWAGYGPGDVITANEPEWGLNGQDLLILTRKIDPLTFKVSLICRFETTGKHAYALGETAVPPDTPGLTAPDPNVVDPPVGDAWSLTAGFVKASDGSQIPAIIITGECENLGAASITVEIRERLTTAPTFGLWSASSFPASSTRLVVAGVTPLATYQVRLRYVLGKGTENPNSNLDLGFITVGQLIAGETMIGGRTASQIVTELAEVNAETLIAQALQDADNRSYTDAMTYFMGSPIGPVFAESLVKTLDSYTKTTILGVLSLDGSSLILDTDFVKLTPTESVAQRFSSVSASIAGVQGNLNAQVIALSSAIVSGDSANASLIAGVSTTVAGHTSSITSLFSSVDGQKARWAVSLNVDGKVSGLESTIYGGISEFIIIANRFGVVDPGGSGAATIPLSYSAGVWKLSGSVYVQSLVADSITTTHLTIAAVTTDKIGDKQVTESAYVADSTTQALTTTEITVASGYIYCFGGDIDIDHQLAVANTGAATMVVGLVYFDGSLLDSWPAYSHGNFTERFSQFAIKQGPSIGWHFVELRARSDDPVNKIFAQIVPTNRKR